MLHRQYYCNFYTFDCYDRSIHLTQTTNLGIGKIIQTKFLVSLMALTLLLTIPTVAFAQRVPPHVFVGTASLNGVAASDGAAVTAWVDGEQVAYDYASDGEYTLLVDQGFSSFAGKSVSFKISGVDASETGYWKQGGAELLDLVAPTGSVSGGLEASGSKGAKGNTGARGYTGAAGAAGSAGVDGADGATGAAGAAGPAGSAGVDGATGPAGAAGSRGADGSDVRSGAVRIIALIVAIAYGLIFLVVGGTYVIRRPS
jgi:hypothetical protein